MENGSCCASEKRKQVKDVNDLHPTALTSCIMKVFGKNCLNSCPGTGCSLH